MERTLEIMEKELKLAKEQFEPLKKKIDELEKEIEKYKLDNALYYPMSELCNYKGKEIRWIKLVERNEDNTLDTDFVCCDEILEVDEDGHFYYSSYDGGIIRYDNSENKYVHYYYGCPEYHDYIGFLEMQFYKYEC